ncbi:MAG TPA: YncE family protein, partial [Candidatus Tumulicola sp.]
GFIPIDANPAGLALTPDGQTLLIASGDRYAALPAAAAARDEVPPVTYLGNRFTSGAIEAMSSPDGSHAFFTNESGNSVGVVGMSKGSGGAPALEFLGNVSTGRLPVGMALSPDGTRLYVTSEIGGDGLTNCNGRRAGTVTVIDTAAAVAAASKAVVSVAPAGCGAVRTAVSPDGATVWVTLRGEDALAAFDSKKLVSDPAHALLRKVPVGAAPVGLALVRNGAFAFVTNSNRFEAATNSTVDVIDTTAALSGGNAIVHTYPTGAFPRELREAPQHDVVYLTNFTGGTVEVLPIP